MIISFNGDTPKPRLEIHDLETTSIIVSKQNEPCYEKNGFLYMRKKRRRSAAQLISAFVFATWIVQSLYFLNQKFQASSHLLWLYSPVCVGPGRIPRRPVSSQRGSNCFLDRASQPVLADLRPKQVFSCGACLLISVMVVPASR